MPYRRLPNTDNARLRALKSAYEMGQEIPPFKLAYDTKTYIQIQQFLPKWEKALIEYQNTYNLQTKNNKEYLRKLKKARMYISHFIQVVNMAILRGDLKEETRTYYGMESGDKKLPSLTSEKAVLSLGKALIDGETKRRMEGHPPITNPTIAVVRVNYDNFYDAHQFQKTLQRNHQRALDHLTNLREEADAIILRIWNEVEATFEELSEESRRLEAQKYGVVYVFRKNELGKRSLLHAGDTLNL
ncbi:MAG: hypothetical protein R6U66_10855 [Bacteroidales bacterium]